MDVRDLPEPEERGPRARSPPGIAGTNVTGPSWAEIVYGAVAPRRAPGFEDDTCWSDDAQDWRVTVPKLRKHPLVDRMELRPYEGFGPFEFGMSREDVRKVIGVPSGAPMTERFLYRLNETEDTAAGYDTYGINIQFTPGGTAGFVGVAAGSGPPVFVRGVELQGTWARIVRDLEQVGLTFVPPAFGLGERDPTRHSYEVGLELLRDERLVRTVGAFGRTYWSECGYDLGLQL